MQVDLLVTCLTDVFQPRAGRAIVAVLEHLGCEVGFPPEQTCCGQPFFNSGLEDEARVLARRTVEIFSRSERVVTPSASCCAMIRERYPRLLGDDPVWAPRLDAFLAKTREFTEFLHDELKLGPEVLARRIGGLPPRAVAFHESCHLRGLGRADLARRYLTSLPGQDHRLLEKADQCCGFGGTFAVKYSELSTAMLADKVSALSSSGAELLVCNDGGCSMNIGGGAHRAGLGTRIVHIAELLAEGMGLAIDEEAPN